MLIDFSNVHFPEEGVFRYILSAIPAGDTDVLYDTQRSEDAVQIQRVLDVYVIDNGGVLEIQTYILHQSVFDVDKANGGFVNKTDGFVNEYLTQNLSFGKEIAGNLASANDVFQFTLEITGARPRAVYTVDLTALNDPGGENPGSIKTDSSGTVEVDFCLKAGQYITVNGLTKGAMYEISEDGKNYTSSPGTSKIAVQAVGMEGETDYFPAKTYSDAPSGTIEETDIYTGFTNTRSIIIPTGVMRTIIPGVLVIQLLLLGIVGAVVISMRKKKW